MRIKPPTLVFVAVAMALLLTSGRADSDQHWTTNGTHRGIISRTEHSQSFDPEGFVGSYTVSYGLWTLMGEPVNDYNVFWKWPTGSAWEDLIVCKATVDGKPVELHVRDLEKYPDLLTDFRNMKPLSIEFNMDVSFLIWNASERTWVPIAFGSKTIRPVMIGQAGQKIESLVPGSPNWDQLVVLRSDPSDDSDSSKKLRGQHNTEVFQKAGSVEMTFGYPAIKHVQWMGLDAWRRIPEKYAERESKTAAAKTNQISRATNAVNQAKATNAAAKPKLATGPNPFEKAAGKTSASPNPFEQADSGTTSGASPNPFEQAASKPANAPANPFELANAGVRTGPENPFEKNARLEAEERARQEAIRREEARLAEVARLEQEKEDARQAEIAELRRQRDRLLAIQEADKEEEHSMDHDSSAEEHEKERQPEASSARKGVGLFLTVQEPTHKWKTKTCYTCKGSGKCWSCNGLGFVSSKCGCVNPITCPRCLGTRYTTFKCYVCDSKGLCPHCRGAKTIEVREEINRSKKD